MTKDPQGNKTTPCAFDQWPDRQAWWARLSQSAHPLLMLDYDGTLAPFVDDRMRAFPYPGITERLDALMNQPRGRVVIITGRDLDALTTLLDPPPGLEVWGEHGTSRMDAQGQRSQRQAPDAYLDALRLAHETLKDHFDDEHIERKPLSVALHTRTAHSSREAQRRARQALEPLCDEHAALHEFDGGVEFRWAQTSKAHAVRSLLTDKDHPQPDQCAYLGDDLTDEDAFEVLRDQDLGLLVGAQARPSLAHAHIKPPEALYEFLDQWIDICAQPR